MSKPGSKPAVNLTVDAAEFFAIGRMLRRGAGSRYMGTVVMSAPDGHLRIECAAGGGILQCNPTPPITADITNREFRQLFDLRASAKASGPLTVVFRPSRHEIVVSGKGAYAHFE